MEIIGGAAALLGRGSGLLPPKPRLRGVSLRVMDKSKATPWKCQGPTATPRRDPSGLSHGSGRIASPAQRERPPTSASAGEGPRAPNAVPVLEALSPLTRRAARAGLSPLRSASRGEAIWPLARPVGRQHGIGRAGVDAFAGATEAGQVRLVSNRRRVCVLRWGCRNCPAPPIGVWGSRTPGPMPRPSPRSGFAS